MANVVQSKNALKGNGDWLVAEWPLSMCVKILGLTKEHYVGDDRPLGDYSQVQEFRGYEDVYIELFEPEAAVQNWKPGWYRAPKEALKTLANILEKAPNFDR